MESTSDINGHARAPSEPGDNDTLPSGAGQLLSLFNKLSKLNADEIDSIDYLTDKLIAGREKHGPLDLASDRRDWFVEATQELADRQCYEAFAAVQRGRRQP